MSLSIKFVEITKSETVKQIILLEKKRKEKKRKNLKILNIYYRTDRNRRSLLFSTSQVFFGLKRSSISVSTVINIENF